MSEHEGEAFSLGPAVWVIISEIYPNRIRGAAVSVSVFALWFGCFTLVYTFPQLTKVFSMAGTFWAYSAVCFAGFLFVWRNLPETKGKSLEQIEEAVEQLRAHVGSNVPEDELVAIGREALTLAARSFDPSLGAALYADSRLPGTARVLFLGETRLYSFRRDAVVPSPFDAHPIEAAVAAAGPDHRRVREALAAQGFTHVLVNWADWERLGRTYYRLHWRAGAVEEADRFVRSLPVVYKDRAATLFALADTGKETE